MRTLYFVEPGQRLNDIKPSKRSRALLLTKQEWQHFGNSLVKKQKELEAIETAVIERENRKICSEEMAKTWDNTIINQRRKRLERLREQQAKIEADRVHRYLEMRKEEAEARKKIVDEAKQLMRLEKDSCKSLISALKFSEVLRERKAQLDFEDKLKAIEAEREHEYACKVKNDAEQYAKEMKEKQKQEREKQQQSSKERMVELQEFMKSKAKMDAVEKELEIQDNINIAKDIKMEKQNALKERQRKMMVARENIKENRRLIEEAKARLKLEAEEEANAIQIHAKAKIRIAKMRKQKEIQTAIEQQKRRNKISEAVSKVREDKDAIEKDIIKRAIEEKEALETARREKQEVYRKQLMQERIKDRETFLEEERQQKEKEKEEFCQEMRERFMNEQENKEYFENLEQQKLMQMKHNKAVWDKQCEELQTVRAEERAQDIAAVKRAAELIKKEDDLFLKYAEDVVEECKQKSRPLFPIICNIQEYKRKSGLLPMSKQHVMWQSKVPIGMDETICKPIEVSGRKPHDPWPNISELQNEKKPGSEIK